MIAMGVAVLRLFPLDAPLGRASVRESNALSLDMFGAFSPSMGMRFGSVRQNLDLGCRDTTAINPTDAQPSADVQRGDRLL
jgi:hypothetical protein